VTEARSPDELAGARSLIQAGSGLVGATAGAWLGLSLTGGQGVVEGAAAGAAIGSVLADIGGRLLGRREKARVGGAAIYASRAYEERIAKGDCLRDDNWFDSRPHGRSIAAEICEGTLLLAQREHEERKIEFYGYMLANISFRPEVDEYLANWLLNLADELTWMQLVLLALVGRKDDFQLPDVIVGETRGDWTQWGLHQQLSDLGYGRRELVMASRAPSETGSGSYSIPARIDRRLVAAELQGAALWLYPLMWLHRVPARDIGTAIDLLQPDSAD